MNDTITPEAPSQPPTEAEECPGHLQWSAYGAEYPDTVCANSLDWSNSQYPGSYLCDADDGFRPNGDIPCPFCAPEGFQDYLGWKDGSHTLLWASDETPVPEGTSIRPRARLPGPGPRERLGAIRTEAVRTVLLDRMVMQAPGGLPAMRPPGERPAGAVPRVAGDGTVNPFLRGRSPQEAARSAAAARAAHERWLSRRPRAPRWPSDCACPTCTPPGTTGR